jgi:dynactin-6
VKAEIKGNVIFGDGCIIHPQCTITAEGGDIIFGDFNIIEEFVNIVNYSRKDASGNIVKKTMRIGNYNLFEVGAVIESTDIGDLNEFGVKSVVMAGSLIGNSCQVNALV